MPFELTDEQADFCRAMKFLFWWKETEELALQPERTLAGVMDRGGVAEWRDMEKIFPREFIIHVLETAKCGEFHNWSWRFWRIRYGLDENAPLPARMPGFPPPSGDYWYKALQRPAVRGENDEQADPFAWAEGLRDVREKT